MALYVFRKIPISTISRLYVDELYDILWLVLLLRVVLGGGVAGQTGWVNVVLGCGPLDSGAAVRNLSCLLFVIWS